MSEASVVVRRDGRAGRIVLNRPKALNALDLEMIRICKEALDAWAEDPHVHVVVIEGAGDRAFCAGGDIIAVRTHAMAGDTAQVEAFFAEEYALNHLIADYPKPYVALIDGICMGGGIGLSVHGAYRVATEHAMFAMPETAIGFFPDVGGTYFLPRLPGELGMYFGLTGARVLGADGVHAGFATHFVPRETLPELSTTLARDGAAALGTYATPVPAFSLAGQRAAIDRCFGAHDLPALIAALTAEGGEWAEKTLATLRGMSPSAVLWSFAAIRHGAGCTLSQALNHELALTRWITKHHEFHEGVRAMVVDKDRKPNWQPARLEDVDPSTLKAAFG